jgi:hypothetical protein
LRPHWFCPAAQALILSASGGQRKYWFSMWMKREALLTA